MTVSPVKIHSAEEWWEALDENIVSFAGIRHRIMAERFVPGGGADHGALRDMGQIGWWQSHMLTAVKARDPVGVYGRLNTIWLAAPNSVTVHGWLGWDALVALIDDVWVHASAVVLTSTGEEKS